MAFDPNELNSKNTPARWRIVGKALSTEEKAKLDPVYAETLDRAALFTSGEEMGVGNQPGVGSEKEPSPVLVRSVSAEADVDELDLNGPVTGQISVTVKPADADDTSVSYSSADEAIATVDGSGLVTPVAEGKVKITVQANDSNGAKTRVSFTVVDTTP
jgi:uncharacterized protein YjdB